MQANSTLVLRSALAAMARHGIMTLEDAARSLYGAGTSRPPRPGKRTAPGGSPAQKPGLPEPER